MAEIDLDPCGACENFQQECIEMTASFFPKGLYGFCTNPLVGKVILVHHEATPRQSLLGNGLMAKAQTLIKMHLTCFQPREIDILTQAIQHEVVANEMGMSIYWQN